MSLHCLRSKLKEYKQIVVSDFSVFLAIVVTITYPCFLFLKRSIFPDTSFDSVNYHFFLGKNGFENFPLFFKPNEFYPLGIHSFNPFSDIIGHGFYLILGYRLGTITSLLFLIGTIILGFIIIRTLFSSSKKRFFIAIMIPPAFLVNEGLFQVGTFFTDNIHAFFVMCYTFFILRYIDTESKFSYSSLVIFGLLGGVIMTKLTNIIYFVPLFILTIFMLIYKHCMLDKCLYREIFKKCVFYIVVVIAVNFSMFYNFSLSQNPIFPLYNSVFHSEYYPDVSFHFNFGPTNLKEILFYPIYAIQKPVLLGEVKDMFPDMKLIYIFIYVLISSIVLFYRGCYFSKQEKVLLFIFFSSFLLWQVQFGYSRYGIFLELLGGMLSIVLVNKILFSPHKWYIEKILTIIFIMIVLSQSWNIINFNYTYDISWRPNVTFEEWKKSFFSMSMFQKYTYINKDESEKLKDIDVVFQCLNPSSVYFSTIRELNNLPLLNFDQQNNGLMTLDSDFIRKRNNRLTHGTMSKNVNFVSIFRKKSDVYGTKEEETCDRILMENGAEIDKRFEIDNFVGNKSDVLKVIVGRYNAN